MRMRQFISTNHCLSGRHCRACRNLAGGRELRASWRSLYAMPEDREDFACPQGRPWGYAGDGPAIPEGAEDICQSCEGLRSCGSVMSCRSCGGGQDVRVILPCPKGKF